MTGRSRIHLMFPTVLVQTKTVDEMFPVPREYTALSRPVDSTDVEWLSTRLKENATLCGLRWLLTPDIRALAMFLVIMHCACVNCPVLKNGGMLTVTPCGRMSEIKKPLSANIMSPAFN